MRRLAALGAVLALAACAHPEVTRYDPASYTDGFIYQRPLPFLQVKPDGSSAVVYLPDPDPHDWYVLRIRGHFGDVGLSPTLQDGWNLTGAQTSVGSSAALQSALSALAGVAAKGAPVGGALFREPPAPPLAAGLYKIDLTTMSLVGPLGVRALDAR